MHLINSLPFNAVILTFDILHNDLHYNDMHINQMALFGNSVKEPTVHTNMGVS